jgi:hypothetical protein
MCTRLLFSYFILFFYCFWCGYLLYTAILWHLYSSCYEFLHRVFVYLCHQHVITTICFFVCMFISSRISIYCGYVWSYLVSLAFPLSLILSYFVFLWPYHVSSFSGIFILIFPLSNLLIAWIIFIFSTLVLCNLPKAFVNLLALEYLAISFKLSFIYVVTMLYCVLHNLLEAFVYFVICMKFMFTL